MAERIRLIITGYDVSAKGDVKSEARTDQPTDYPINPPETMHGACRAAIILFLSAFVKTRSLGWVLSEGTAFDLEPGSKKLIAPDISLVSFEQLPADAYLDPILSVPPDLAIDFVAQSEKGETLIEKVMQYLDLGISQVWLIEPRLREVFVFTPADRNGVSLAVDDDLHGEGLIEGFSIPVRALFEEDNASQVEVLKRLIGA